MANTTNIMLGKELQTQTNIAFPFIYRIYISQRDKNWTLRYLKNLFRQIKSKKSVENHSSQ